VATPLGELELEGLLSGSHGFDERGREFVVRPAVLFRHGSYLTGGGLWPAGVEAGSAFAVFGSGVPVECRELARLAASCFSEIVFSGGPMFFHPTQQ